MNDSNNIGSILLHYNSPNDLFNCINDLVSQEGIKQKIIIIDNNSMPDHVASIKKWCFEHFPTALIGSYEVVENHIKQGNIRPKLSLVLHNQNNGYSAGNNLGFKLAKSLGCDAVLIANPDMRFPDARYIYSLYSVLKENTDNVIAASRIIGLDDKQQSPLREASFYDEFFWFRNYLPSFFHSKPFILNVEGNTPIEVSKVMGCALLISTDYLAAIDYFDEGVFLFSEEAILASKVQRDKKKIIFSPHLSAIHAHNKNEKGNGSLRMLLYIKSRLYYLENYSKYNTFQKWCLKFSYSVLKIMHIINSKRLT